jgi:hypothetical protein
MLRNMSQTVGSAMAALCLVSTLAVAQPQPSSRPMGQSETPALSESPTPAKNQPLTLVCTKDDGKGNCTAGAGTDGKEMVVVGEGMTKGAAMTCVNKTNAIACDPIKN